MTYISATEKYTGVPDDHSILKKLENRFKGYREIKLNLNDFIRHNNLSLILNNELIKNNNFYFEYYNYDELFYTDRDNMTEYITEELKAGIDNNKDYNYINEVFNTYYVGDHDSINDFFNMNIEDALDELEDAIDEYCTDMFYEWNGEIYQYFIISEYDANHYWSKYTSYPILYDYDADIYLLGITHYGMSWDYFSTEYTVREYF